MPCLGQYKRQQIVKADTPQHLYALLEQVVTDGAYVQGDTMTLCNASQPTIGPEHDQLISQLIETVLRQGFSVRDAYKYAIETLGKKIAQTADSKGFCAVVVHIPDDYELNQFDRRQPNVLVSTVLTPELRNSVKNQEDKELLGCAEFLQLKLVDFIHAWSFYENCLAYETQCQIVSQFRKFNLGILNELVKAVFKTPTLPAEPKSVPNRVHKIKKRRTAKR